MSAIGGPASGAELGWVSRDCDPKIRCLKGVYVFVVTVEALKPDREYLANIDV